MTILKGSLILLKYLPTNNYQKVHTGTEQTSARGEGLLLARSGLTLGAWGLRGLTPSGPGLNMPNLREWALESR